MNPYLTISGSPISIAKKGESHHYLGIFLLTKGLSKPSLVKTHSDGISDKQFVYLVFTVLFLIICYRMQFSFILLSMCNKWNALIHKELKSKSGLSLDFSSDVLHHPSLYGLKTFEQVQAESKSAFIVSFANSVGILGHLFSHRFYNLQVLSWHPLYPLQFLVHIGVSPSNNFLAGVVYVFNDCDLFLGNSLASAFHFRGGTPMSFVLGKSRFHKCVSFLHHYNIAFVEQLCDRNSVNFNWKTFKRWKRLDPCSPVSAWFEASAYFLNDVMPFLDDLPLRTICISSGILQSHEFGVISDSLLHVNTTCLSVFTDGFLSGLETVDMKAGAAYFEDVDLGLGVEVSGLVSSMIAELQMIALALKCIPLSHSIDLFLDSQAALDVCRFESSLLGPDFRNHCWMEHYHIVNVICQKNLRVNWVKVRGHSGVLGNKCANMFAKTAALSGWHLPHSISKQFLKTGNIAISGNSRHFVHDIFHSIHCVHWEVGSGSHVMTASLCADINWPRSLLVWHLDFYLAAGFISVRTAGLCSYFMKTLHHQLPVAVHKHLYSRLYSSVMCLFCEDVEVSDYVFSCLFDATDCVWLMDIYASAWKLLFDCAANVDICAALCKGFVFNGWFNESVSVFKDPEVASLNIVNFVCKLCNELILHDDFIPILVSGLSLMLLAGVVRLLDITNAHDVSFGLCKSRQFLLDISDVVSVYIGE
ncbi:hypothetical protein G9A89_016048 [Geosiphon pyriformis]|nr:hypothetical protein G9A89_016048 [Geosiphon pyriformis]